MKCWTLDIQLLYSTHEFQTMLSPIYYVPLRRDDCNIICKRDYPAPLWELDVGIMLDWGPHPGRSYSEVVGALDEDLGISPWQIHSWSSPISRPGIYTWSSSLFPRWKKRLASSKPSQQRQLILCLWKWLHCAQFLFPRWAHAVKRFELPLELVQHHSLCHFSWQPRREMGWHLLGSLGWVMVDMF